MAAKNEQYVIVLMTRCAGRIGYYGKNGVVTPDVDQAMRFPSQPLAGGALRYHAVSFQNQGWAVYSVEKSGPV